MKKQINFLYDGSFEGMLTAVALAVKTKDVVADIRANRCLTPTLLDENRSVQTDHSQAMRIFQYLRNLDAVGSRLAIDGFLSENEEMAIHLYHVVRACLHHGGDALNWHTHDSVRFLHMLSQKVRREAHRFYGLLRFRVLESGLQYAPFEPDYNVIGYCAHHFRQRLSSIDWVLHDIRRNQALYWDGATIQNVDIDDGFTSQVRSSGELPLQHLCQSEIHYQRLWSTFHKAITIGERRNPALQKQWMPLRYWKYLPEISRKE